MTENGRAGSSGEEPGLFPTAQEAERIVLGPESVLWRRFGDVRIYFGAGYALLLQVAHPTVGAGVRDHSDFERDPYGRLLRTMDYLSLLIYGGSEAVAVGRRLRRLHEPIRGTMADGTPYSALEPEAFAWVHATLLLAGLDTHERFVGHLGEGERDAFRAEFLPLGRLLGIAPGALPADREGFRAYFEEMVADRLVRTESVDAVMRTLARPAGPPLPGPLARIWPLVRVPPARAVDLATRGLLPPVLRSRFGVRWSLRDEAELRALATASRATGLLLPRDLRVMGPAYLKWRRREIAAGPLGRD